MKKIELIAQVGLGCALTAALVLSFHQNVTADESKSSASAVPIKIPPSGYKPKPINALSKKGQKEFAALNCAACHAIHGAGGCLGPVLDGIGGKRTQAYMEARITDSAEAMEKFAKLTNNAGELMPHPRISVSRAKEIVAYLETLPEPKEGFVLVPHVNQISDEEPAINLSFKPQARSTASYAGAKLYAKFGCAACHSIGKIGGWVAPKLDGVGGRRSRNYIIAHVTNAKAHSIAIGAKPAAASVQMPQFNASSVQIEQIADFLETLPSAD